MTVSWLRRLFAPRRTPLRKALHARDKYRPRMEPLEERCTPAGTVINTNDAGVGSLRAALVGGGNVDFAANMAGQTINVLSTLTFAANTNVINANNVGAGPGAGLVTVAGNQTFSIFDNTGGFVVNMSGLGITLGSTAVDFEAGAFTNFGTLNIFSCAIFNNRANSPTNPPENSGGIFNSSTGLLNVTFCTFTSNTSLLITSPTTRAGGGGGIQNDGIAVVSNCTFTNNVGGKAGGIDNNAGGILTLQDSVLTGNIGGRGFDGGGGVQTAGRAYVRRCAFINGRGGDAGGIATYTGSYLNVDSCSFTGGVGYFPPGAYSQAGGGISIYGQAVITNSTITGNQGVSAGGIDVYDDGSAVVVNCTIGNNTSEDTGGGINAVGSSSLQVINCTIIGNAGTTGGGVVANGTGTNIMINTIVTGNVLATGGGSDVTGVFGTALNNLISSVDMSTNITNGVNGNICGTAAAPVNPLLSGFGNFGGLTQTLALLPGSPAIDAGIVVPGVPATDQRGMGRVGAVDIGAFESQKFVMTIVSGNEQFQHINQQYNLPLVVLVTANNPIEPVAGGLVLFSAPADAVGVATVIFPGGGRVVFPAGVATAPFPTGVGTEFLNGVIKTIQADGTASTTVTANSYPGCVDVFVATTGANTLTFELLNVRELTLAGAGPGATPTVKVYDALTGVFLTELTVLPADFRGGVRVAMGDVTGDCVPDIIIGAGPGGGPQVVVVNGLTFQTVLSFFAFAPTFSGGVFVAAGDVDGDEIAEIIAGADAGGGPQVTVFKGDVLVKSFFAFPPTFAGGVRVAAGDINGDGIAEIIVGAGAGGLPQVTVYDFQTLAVVQSFFAFSLNFRGGVFVASTDTFGNAPANIIVGAGAGGLPQVTVFNGLTLGILQSFFAFPPEVPKVDFSFIGGGAHVGFQPFTNRILTGARIEAPPLVRLYNATNLNLDREFFAFENFFIGGVFVAGG